MPLGGLLPYNRSGNREDEEDDLLNGMLGDEEPATMPPPVNQAQPMPDLAGTDANVELPGDSPHWGTTNPGQGVPLPGQPGSRNDGIAGGLGQGVPLPGQPGSRNDGITGRGSFAPGGAIDGGAMAMDAPPERVAGGAMARYGTGNIPGAENTATGDFMHKLRGFNTNEWGAGGTEGYEDSSIKNTFGKIASRYDSSPDGLRQLVQDPEFMQHFPEATILDHPTDPKIDFGDGNPVDVLFQTDQGWQWLPENEAGGGGGMGGAPGGGVGGLIGMGEQATNPDALAAIMAQIESLQNGRNPMEDDALNDMLR